MMLRTFAQRALPAVAAVFTACSVVQVFLAGLGVFEGPAAFITHREFGWTYGWLTLAILVLALAGRAPRRITAAAVLLLVLFAMQSVLVALRTEMPALAALHPLNGFAILGIGGLVARASWLARRAYPASEGADPAPGGAGRARAGADLAPAGADPASAARASETGGPARVPGEAR